MVAELEKGLGRSNLCFRLANFSRGVRVLAVAEMDKEVVGGGGTKRAVEVAGDGEGLVKRMKKTDGEEFRKVVKGKEVEGDGKIGIGGAGERDGQQNVVTGYREVENVGADSDDGDESMDSESGDESDGEESDE